MGLDMYLEGHKYFWSLNKKRVMKEGFEKTNEVYQLGYWRKHPNLHGYIVNTFAEGKDDCRDIYLSEDDLVKIIGAVTDGNLPHTTGFFFGTSDGSEKESDLAILNAALKWLRKAEPDVSRSVYYRASW